jgi:hypothetical protein
LHNRLVETEKALVEGEKQECHILYHPLALTTPHRKVFQIYLLDNKIRRLKKRFNKTFALLQGEKEASAALITEKSKRIKEIFDEIHAIKEHVQSQVL